MLELVSESMDVLLIETVAGVEIDDPGMVGVPASACSIELTRLGTEIWP
jgi:hypothetical protein